MSDIEDLGKKKLRKKLFLAGRALARLSQGDAHMMDDEDWDTVSELTEYWESIAYEEDEEEDLDEEDEDE